MRVCGRTKQATARGSRRIANPSVALKSLSSGYWALKGLNDVADGRTFLFLQGPAGETDPVLCHRNASGKEEALCFQELQTPSQQGAGNMPPKP